MPHRKKIKNKNLHASKLGQEPILSFVSLQKALKPFIQN